MALINKDFYKGETEYSDGSVEDIILDIVRNNSKLEKYYENNENWPIFYHLSHLRENILNWYPFKKNCSILEIGAGCGALTGLFSQKSDCVTSVELTDKRAEIIYERYKDKDNIEIFVGNLNNMKFEKKFDYIIVNGVLEYAKQFTNTSNPFKDFLTKLKSFLKKDGIILLSIENRLGLKYLSGFREDHTGKFFSGINNYNDNDSVRTFSKVELEKLIESVGFSNYKFFYPYPDYKFPNIIYTDDSIEKYFYYGEIPNYDQERVKFFNEISLNNSLKEENISKHFSNSFLLEIKNDGNKLSDDIKFVKLSNDRKKEFRIATSIEKYNGELVAIKSPLSKDSENHLKLMEKSQKKNKIDFLHYLPSERRENKLIFPFIQLKTLKIKLLELANENKINEFKETIKLFRDNLLNSSITCNNYHSNEFSKVFGDLKVKKFYQCLEYPNIDLILGNIFIEKEKYIVIDYEWCFDFPIPVDFILWRAISNLYYLTDLNDFISKEYLLNYLDIPFEDYDIFHSWEKHFQIFIKGNDLYKILIDPKLINKPIIDLNSDNISKYPYDMLELEKKSLEINNLKLSLKNKKNEIKFLKSLLKIHNKEIKNIKFKLKKSNKSLKKVEDENKKHINSIKYQIGTLMTQAATPSKTSFSWPFHLIKLFIKSKNKKEKDLKISKKPEKIKFFKELDSYEVEELLISIENGFKINNSKINLNKKLISSNLQLDVNKKSILYVVHEWGGGAYFTAEDLMKEVSKYKNTFILIPNDKKIKLYFYDSEKNKIKLTHTFKLKNKWNNQKNYLKEYRNIYFNILINFGIDLVHIHQLITQTFDLPKIAKILNIPVVLSLHDYYFVCPSIHLLDDGLNFCEGSCENSKNTCRKFSPITLGYHEDIRNFLPLWRKEVSKMFENIDQFVYTSKTLKNIYFATYPNLIEDKFIFIEHGEKFSPEKKNFFTPPSKDKPIKILFSNVHNEIKGLELIKSIKNLDIDEKLEFHFLGRFNHDLKGYGISHGKFKRNNFHKKVKEISPSFIGLLSIWPETFSYVLSESWDSGVPVLGSNIGALGERIAQNGGGWFIDYKNPQKAYDSILEISNNLEEYQKTQKEIEGIYLRSVEEMVKDYLDLYSTLFKHGV